jgi:hypothetical protein
LRSRNSHWTVVSAVDMSIFCSIVWHSANLQVLSRTFVRIGSLEREAKRCADFLQRLDQAIFAKAFRGELVVQDMATSSVATIATE